MKTKLFSVLMILMILSSSFASAANITKEEKAVDKTKLTAQEITHKDKNIGKVTVTDNDVSKYTVKKKSDTEISISKSEATGEHTKSKVTFAKEDLHKIDIDDDQLYGVLHIADDGSTSHDVYTEAQLTSGTEMMFSENIVNGYSGYIEQTYTGVTSGTVLNTPDVSGSDYYITASVTGTVPASSQLNELDTSTYPKSSNLVLAMPMYNNTNIVNGAVYSSKNVTFYPNGTAWYNGIDANTTIGTLFTANQSRLAMVWRGSVSNTSVAGGLFGTGYSTDLALYISTGSLYFYKESENSGASTLSNGFHTTIGNTNGTHNMLNVDGARVKLITSTKTFSQTNPFVAMKYYASGWKYKKGFVDMLAVYNTSLTLGDAVVLHTKYHGISFNPVSSTTFTGYNVSSGSEKTISTSGTTTGIKVYNSEMTTLSSVTIRVYFTEDITKISDTMDAHSQNTRIVHIKGNGTASVGLITYEIDSAYWNDPTMLTNNTNASVTRNATHFLINTGLLKAGQSFYYDVTTTNLYNDNQIDDDITDTFIVLSDDIDSAFVLAALILTITIGLTMLVLLSSILTGTIDFKLAVASVLIVIISEAVILFGLILISQIYDGLLYI